MDASKPSSVRVAFVVEGTRGDCQPYVALALRMQDRGNAVRFFTNENHVKFCNDFGVSADGVLYDAAAAFALPHVKDALSSGSALGVQKALTKIRFDNLEVDLKRLFDAMDAYKPTVLVYGTLSRAKALCYSIERTVPVIALELQAMLPTSDTPPAGLPKLPFGWNKAWFKLLIMAAGTAIKDFKAIADKSLNLKLDGKLEMPYMGAFFWDLPAVPCPSFYGFSTHVIPRHPEWPQENMNICGFFIIDKKKQEAVMNDRTKGAEFGAGTNAELTAFLEAGAPPVYMGWGSMICKSPEWMLEVAIGALKHASARGVLLGGWAGLGLSSVPPALQEFCKSNVLFVPSAPHEWLFPRCAVLVHHGGSGTTAASVRSGKPTVVTPLMGDQFDFAEGINRSGCGVGMPQMSTLTATALGDAVKRCLTDNEVISKAKSVGAELQQEDGAANFIKAFDAWITDDFVTGKWSTKHAAMLMLCEEANPKKKKCCC